MMPVVVTARQLKAWAFQKGKAQPLFMDWDMEEACVRAAS